MGQAFASLIRTIGGNGIEAVGDADDFGAQGDLSGRQAEGITAAVHAFMVAEHYINNVFGTIEFA